MKKLFKNTDNLIPLIIFFCLILFLPGFFTYFHQDDFIHLSYSQSINQVFSAFNIFQHGEFPFYRPIPTQVYFYLGRLLFGFNPLYYHLVNFIIFSVNIILVYRFASLIIKKEIAGIATIFFAVNSTHFAPLYSAAYVHELFYVLFGVLTVDNFSRWNLNHKLKNYIFSVIFFIFALMSKETAVVLPILILTLYFLFGLKGKLIFALKTILPYFFILGLYLYSHFLFYGIAQGSSYAFIIGKPTLNILTWYFLWALSTPNILIDFIGPGLKLNTVFFQVTHFQGIIYFVLFPIFILAGLILLWRFIHVAGNKKHNNLLKIIISGLLWFVIGMFPLIIFPLHKLATEQAFSLVGLSIALASVLFTVYNSSSRYRLLPAIFIGIYLVIAVNSILLGRKTHWIVRSAQQAKNAVEYIKANYPNLDNNALIYFRNGDVKIPQYGSSRQIYQALGNGIGLNLILGKPNLKLYFEEINPIPVELNQNRNIIQLDSSKLLGY